MEQDRGQTGPVGVRVAGGPAIAPTDDDPIERIKRARRFDVADSPIEASPTVYGAGEESLTSFDRVALVA